MPLPAKIRCNDEASPPPAGAADQRVVGPGAEAEWAPIGDDDQGAGGLTGVVHGSFGQPEGSARSSAARRTSTAWGRSSCSGRLR